MGLETLVERLRETGHHEADAILKEARAERERLLEGARAEGRKLLERRGAEAREQAERRRVQDLARAELDAKKLVLAAREEVIRAVRDRARVLLAALPSGDALKKLLTKNAAEWRAGRVYANAKDAAAVKAIVGGAFA